MSLYKVQWDYAAHYDEQDVRVAKGEVVDLPEAQAAWMNRDSPGVLKPYTARKRAARRPPNNRQVTEAKSREPRVEPITRETFGAVKDKGD